MNPSASAALVFTILYAIDLVVLIFLLTTRLVRFRSRYSVLLFHVIVRLAAQGCGLAFGYIGFANVNILVAYFVLGAEGYVSLVVCTYRFLITYQYLNYLCRDSWLEPRLPKESTFVQRVVYAFDALGRRRHPMAMIHASLIVSNAIVITGGSLVAGDTPEQYQAQKTEQNGLRTSGQAVFLIITLYLLYALVDAVITSLRELRQTGRRVPGSLFGVHPTLLILCVVWPLLFVRGLYGLMSGSYGLFNYFDPGNYTGNGLSNKFVVLEYVLSTTMEWTACTLLLCTFLTSRKDPKKEELVEGGEPKLTEANSSDTMARLTGA